MKLVPKDDNKKYKQNDVSLLYAFGITAEGALLIMNALFNINMH